MKKILGKLAGGGRIAAFGMIFGIAIFSFAPRNAEAALSAPSPAIKTVELGMSL